jgi:sugar-specific transcriptional regulator TrmB
MSETKTLLAELDQKVSGLLENIQRLHDENQAKEARIESLKSELEEKANENEGLKKENELLKKDQLESTEVVKDQEALKEKIGEMVKEIDRCISLLKV